MENLWCQELNGLRPEESLNRDGLVYLTWSNRSIISLILSGLRQRLCSLHFILHRPHRQSPPVERSSPNSWVLAWLPNGQWTLSDIWPVGIFLPPMSKLTQTEWTETRYKNMASGPQMPCCGGKIQKRESHTKDFLGNLRFLKCPSPSLLRSVSLPPWLKLWFSLLLPPAYLKWDLTEKGSLY